MCFSLFHREHNPDVAVHVAEYKEQYEQVYGKMPQCSIAVAGVCTETEEYTERLIAQAKKFSPSFYPGVMGTQQQCKEQLLELQHRTGVDEIIFLDLAIDQQNRLTCMNLLAEAFNLKETIPARAEVSA